MSKVISAGSKVNGSDSSCENCHYHGEGLMEVVYGGDRAIYLCDLCFNTDLGAHIYTLDGVPNVTPSMLAQGLHWLRESLIIDANNEE